MVGEDELLRRAREWPRGAPGALGVTGRLVNDLADALSARRQEIERLRKAWDFLASNRRLSLDPCGPVYCDDDDQFSGWRVHRESGPINDREWEIVGEGDTPLLAVEAAIANL